MKTEAWIDALAQGAGPAPRGRVAGRLLAAWIIGLAGAVALALRWPWQPVALGSGGWVLVMKLGYTGALALAALALCARLARPAAPLAGPVRAVGAVVLAMLVLALGSLAATPQAARWGLVAQASAATCAAWVAGLSLPALAAGLWAMRGLAPTRPGLSGAVLGGMAGALGALAYGLICPEPSPVYVALWYTAAMAGPAALGAWLGPKLLRW